MSKYVAYFRVSTDRQGASGLGLEAQQAAVIQYADGIIHSFTEIESGKHDDRPQLQARLLTCPLRPRPPVPEYFTRPWPSLDETYRLPAICMV